MVERFTGPATQPSSKTPECKAAAAKVREVRVVESFKGITGRGVKRRVGGTLCLVGNHRLAEEKGVCGPHVEAVLGRLEA